MTGPLTARIIEARARQILREDREISPGAISAYSEEDIDAIVGEGAVKALATLRPLERLPKVTLYRAVMVESADGVELQALGIYWTWDKELADPYWGVARYSPGAIVPDPVVLKAVVLRKDIDWATSGALLALRGQDEGEIRVRKGAKVFLVSMGDVPYNVQARA